jgi:hypothetical protein
MKLYRQLRLLRLKIKESQPPAQEHTKLETLAQVATSIEEEIQAGIHQEEVTSPVREKGTSSKKP